MPASFMRLLLLYGTLLLASHVVRWSAPDEGALKSSSQRQAIPESLRGKDSGRTIQIAYQDWNEAGESAPVLVLLHGSPGDANTFGDMVPLLKDRYRLIVPDLPGFRGRLMTLLITAPMLTVMK